jgi:ribosomal protein S18 acetylase RimI-like enzyme
MNVAEQWNDTRKDLERMFDYEPRGCFIAEVDDSPVGQVFSISYGHMGWIGLLIVKAEFRRKGIASLLAKMAKDYLSKVEVATVKLEAVPEIANLYRELDFIDEYDSLRFRSTNTKNTRYMDSPMSTIKPKNLHEVVKFDAVYFGADRTKVLEQLYFENPNQCLVAFSRSDVVGYIMWRNAYRGIKLGPWVCDPQYEQTATELLCESLKRIGRKPTIYVGVPAPNKKAIEILKEFGFEQYSKSIRMYCGKKQDGQVEGILAIGGPMKG